jgi:hypothetical protein
MDQNIAVSSQCWARAKHSLPICSQPRYKPEDFFVTRKPMTDCKALIVLSPLFGFLRADLAAGAVLVGEGRDGGAGTGPGNDDVAARHLEKAPASKWAQFLPRDHALSLGHNGRGATHSG